MRYYMTFYEVILVDVLMNQVKLNEDLLRDILKRHGLHKKWSEYVKR